MTRPADSWASAMSTTARPFGSHSYKLCGSGTVTAPPRVRREERPAGHMHSRTVPFHPPVHAGSDARSRGRAAGREPVAGVRLSARDKGVDVHVGEHRA